MPVQNIKIGGEQRPIFFGFNALANLGRLTNNTYEQLLSPHFLGSLENQLTIVKVGLDDGARKEKIKEVYSVEQVADWIDEEPNALDEVFGVFMQQVLSIAAKKKGIDPEKFLKEVMKEVKS